MARILALFLIFLTLLQTFSQELLVVDYQVHKAQITRLFCVNKDKPRLQCNGRCHLAKQLRKTSDQESKAPAGIAKVKYEVLPPFILQLVGPAASWPQPVRFAPADRQFYAHTPAHSIFHPPAFQA